MENCMMKCLNKVGEIKVSYYPKVIRGPNIGNAADCLIHFKNYYNLATIALQEEFLIMYLNRANNVLGIYRHTKGSMSGTMVDVRMILAIGLKLGAHSIILSHNHPSNNLKPSNQDIEITNKIKEAGKLMDVFVIDHIIVDTKFNYYSFLEGGML